MPLSFCRRRLLRRRKRLDRERARATLIECHDLNPNDLIATESHTIKVDHSIFEARCMISRRVFRFGIQR